MAENEGPLYWAVGIMMALTGVYLIAKGNEALGVFIILLVVGKAIWTVSKQK